MSDLSRVFHSAFKNVFTECKGCKHYKEHINMIATESKAPCKYCSRHFYDKYESALSADTVSREAHYDAVANRITDMEERGFVSVVRCKDCKYWGGNKITEHNSHICNRALDQDVDYWTRADDFCSYGERGKE